MFSTGWGATRGGHPGAAKTLQQAMLPIVSPDTCRKKYSSRIHNDYHICAGEGRAGASGGCNGDSGGPLTCEEGGRWYLHGAVSFGKLHCPTEYYTVFARVSNYVRWIQTTTGIKSRKKKLFFFCFHGINSISRHLIDMFRVRPFPCTCICLIKM